MSAGDSRFNRDRAILLTETEAVAELADEWRELAEPIGNPFVTPEWFLAWVRAFGSGWEPRVAVVRHEHGRLRGVVPLIASAGGGRIRLRACRGDRFQPVAAVGDEAAVARSAAGVLAAAGAGRVTLELDNVDVGAAWWMELAEATQPPLAIVRRPQIELPFIDLDGLDWQGYLGGRSRQLRSQLGRKMRALRREHEVRLRRTADAAEVDRDLDQLFRLHAARWAQRGEPSGFDKPAVRGFHGEFAHAAQRHGWLRLYALEVDGAAIAALYGWLIGGRWSYLQAGLDPAWSRYSPGFLLLAETIREAIEQGATEYDLLLGDESYKYRFATGARRGRSVVLVGRADPARLSVAGRARLRGAWRRLPPASRLRAKRLAARLGVRRW